MTLDAILWRRLDLSGHEVPRFGYSGLLRVDASGFVHDYPELWERVAFPAE